VKNYPLEKVHEAIQEYNKVRGGHKVRYHRSLVCLLGLWQVVHVHVDMMRI
jgi:hypothetical protein